MLHLFVRDGVLLELPVYFVNGFKCISVVIMESLVGEFGTLSCRCFITKLSLVDLLEQVSVLFGCCRQAHSLLFLYWLGLRLFEA